MNTEFIDSPDAYVVFDPDDNYDTFLRLRLCNDVWQVERYNYMEFTTVEDWRTR